MLEKSIYELFKTVCERHPDKVAYRYKAGDEWKPVTWSKHQETCKKISKSLMALGIEKGAGTAGHEKTGSLSRDKLREIAKLKANDLNANSIEAAERIIEGTARSMGVEIG